MVTVILSVVSVMASVGANWAAVGESWTARIAVMVAAGRRIASAVGCSLLVGRVVGVLATNGEA